MAQVSAPLDLLDPKKLHGTYDLGLNATGVVSTKLIIDSDSITTVDSAPAGLTTACFREVKQLSDRARNRRPGGYVKGRIPFPIYQMWCKQYREGPQQHGVLWRAFLSMKIEDRDFSKFNVDKA